MKVIFIDTETSGLDPEKDQIIELAAVTNNGDMFQEYCNYEGVLPEKIVELTGITDNILEEKGKSEKDVYKSFTDWLDFLMDKYNRNEKAVMVGYNVNFDHDFLRKLFEKNGDKYFGSWFFNCRLDVLSIVAFAKCVGALGNLENYKQETVAKHLGFDIDGLHSALLDANMTRKILIKLTKLIREKI